MRLVAIISSVGCIAAGLWLLQTQPADSSSLFGPFMHAIGLYFIAKGFYVGPSLYHQFRTRVATEWLAYGEEMFDKPRPDITPERTKS